MAFGLTSSFSQYLPRSLAWHSEQGEANPNPLAKKFRRNDTLDYIPLDDPSNADNENAALVQKRLYANSKAPFLTRPGRNFRARLWARAKRWWMVDLVISCLLSILITLLLIYIYFPYRAQSDFDRTMVTVQGTGLSEPMPGSYRFSINTTQVPFTPFSPSLDPFQVSLYLADYNNNTPFSVVDFPAIQVMNPIVINITNQLVPIENVEAFKQYLQVAFFSESYRVKNKGTTKLHLGFLPATTVEYENIVTLPGLNGLKNISTFDLKVTLDPSSPYNFYANVSIPNPSTSIATVGNLTYNTYIDGDVLIGQSYLDNVVLYPGDNVFSLRANNSETPVVEYLTRRPGCDTGLLPVVIEPVSAHYHGQEIEWLLSALSNVTQLLPVTAAISTSSQGRVNLTCLADATVVGH